MVAKWCKMNINSGIIHILWFCLETLYAFNTFHVLLINELSFGDVFWKKLCMFNISVIFVPFTQLLFKGKSLISDQNLVFQRIKNKFLTKITNSKNNRKVHEMPLPFSVINFLVETQLKIHQNHSVYFSFWDYKFFLFPKNVEFLVEIQDAIRNLNHFLAHRIPHITFQSRINVHDTIMFWLVIRTELLNRWNWIQYLSGDGNFWNWKVQTCKKNQAETKTVYIK